MLELTIAGWRAWAKTCALPTFASRPVLRSALCLKLHAYNDTGAIIAAATTSIPEAIGSERTWDYRYCWLRDAAFVVEALRRLGHLAEGEAFVSLSARHGRQRARCSRSTASAASATSSRSISTICAGFGGAGPVRIGNAAYHAAAARPRWARWCCASRRSCTDPRVVIEDPNAIVRLVERLVEEAMARARARRHRPLGVPHAAAALHVLARRCAGSPRIAARSSPQAWHARAGARTGARGQTRDRERDPRARLQRASSATSRRRSTARHPDASNLLLPTLGLIDPRDPRFVSTRRAPTRSCSSTDGLMLRYRHHDDFGDTTSAFSICSFWWVEALAMIGGVDDAVPAVRAFADATRIARPVFRRHRAANGHCCSATFRRPTRTWA